MISSENCSELRYKLDLDLLYIFFRGRSATSNKTSCNCFFDENANIKLMCLRENSRA